MRELIFLVPFFFILIFQPAFAQDDSQDKVNQAIEQFLNFTNDFIEAQINASSWLDQQKKDELNKATDSGLEAGRTTVSSVSNIRSFIVHTIFAGSPIPFNYGIVFLVAFVISVTFLFVLLWKIVKKFWKVALPIVAIIAIILISGIQLPTM